MVCRLIGARKINDRNSFKRDFIKAAFNPLSPNSDRHQISPCAINAYSTSEVMRIKDMITQVNFLDILQSFSPVRL